MPNGVNLTPPQEIKRQKTQYVVGASTKAAVLLVLILVGIAAYFYTQSSSLKNQVSSLETQETDLMSQRDSMTEIEGYAKKLSGKYFLLQKYLESRLKYSSVILELLARVPAGVAFENLDFEGAGKRTRVSGTSSDVVSVSAFVNSLAKEGNSSSESSVSLGGKNAFSDVRLDSLKVDEGKSVEYSVSFKINEEAFLR